MPDRQFNRIVFFITLATAGVIAAIGNVPLIPAAAPPPAHTARHVFEPPQNLSEFGTLFSCKDTFVECSKEAAHLEQLLKPGPWLFGPSRNGAEWVSV